LGKITLGHALKVANTIFQKRSKLTQNQDETSSIQKHQKNHKILYFKYSVPNHLRPSRSGHNIYIWVR